MSPTHAYAQFVQNDLLPTIEMLIDKDRQEKASIDFTVLQHNKGDKMLPDKTASTLFEAILRAKSRFPAIPKRGLNPFFKSPGNPKGSAYMLYDDILAGCNPILHEEGLYLEHCSRWEGDRYFVGSVLVHAETKEYGKPFELPLAFDPNPQKMSAGVTYARRVTASGVLGLASDDDDDGNGANIKPPKNTISEDERKMLIKTLDENGWMVQEGKLFMKAFFGKDNTASLTKVELEEFVQVICGSSFDDAMKRFK